MQDPSSIVFALTQVLPLAYVFNLTVYFACSVFMFLITSSMQWTAADNRFIQQVRASRSDILREISLSLRAAGVFAILTAAIVFLANNGFALFEPQRESTWLEVIAYFIFLVFAFDCYFYWTHRAMHHPRLFKHFHKGHHKSKTPTAFASFAFDWPEAAVYGFFFVLCALLTPTPPTAYLLFIWALVFRVVIGHSGVELDPKWFAQSRVAGFFTNATHHDMHHSGSLKYNFGLFLTFWDRHMGTENPNSIEKYVDKGTTPYRRERSREG